MKIKNRLTLYLLSIMFCCYQQIASMHRVPSGISLAAAEEASKALSGISSPTPATPTGYERPSYVDAPTQHKHDIIKSMLETEAQPFEEEHEILKNQDAPSPSENVYGESTIQGSGDSIDLSKPIDTLKGSSVGRFLGFKKDESVPYSNEQKEQLKIILFGRLDNEDRRDLAITLRQAWSNIEKNHPDLVQHLLDGFYGKTDVKALEESISDLKELLLELQPSQPKTQISAAALYPKRPTKKPMWSTGYVPNVQKQEQHEPVQEPQKLRMTSTKSKTKLPLQKQREIAQTFKHLPDTDLAPTSKQEETYQAAIALKKFNDAIKEKELAQIAEELKRLEQEQENATQEMKETEDRFHETLTKEIQQSENQAIEMQRLREQRENIARENIDQRAQNNLEKLYDEFSEGLQSAAQLSKNEQERIQEKEQLLQDEIDERNKLAKRLDRSKKMAAYKQDLREMNEKSTVEEQATKEKQQIESEYARLLQAEKQARHIAAQRQHLREQEEKAEKERAEKKEIFDQKRKNADRQKDLKKEIEKEKTKLKEQKARDAAIKQEEESKQASLKNKQKKDLQRQQNEESDNRDQIEKELRDLQESIKKDIKSSEQAALEKQRQRKIAENLQKLEAEQEMATQEMKDTEERFHKELTKEIKKSETTAFEMQRLREQRENIARENIDQRAQTNLKNLYDEFEQGLQSAAREALTDRQQIATKQTERKKLEQSVQRGTDYLTNEEDQVRAQITKNFEPSKKQALTKQRSREMNERRTVEEQATTEKQQIESEYDRLLHAEKQARQIAAQKQHHREQEERAQKERASKDEKDKKQKELYKKNRKKKQEQNDLKKEIEKKSKELQEQKARDVAIKQQEESEQASLKNQQEKEDRHKTRKQNKQKKDLQRQQNEESDNRDHIEKEQRDLQEAINRDIKASKQAALEKQRNREIAEQFSNLPGSTDLEPTEIEQKDYNDIIKNELRRKISEGKEKLDDLTKDQTLTATPKVFNSTRPMITAAQKNPQSLPQEIKEEEELPPSKSYAQESLNDQTAKAVHSQPNISTSTTTEPATTTTPQTQTYASTQAPAQQTTTSQPSNTTSPTSTYAKQPVPKSYAKEPFSDQSAEAVHSMFTENEEPPASESNPEPFHFETTPTQPEPAKAMQHDISSEETTPDDSTPDNENNATHDNQDNAAPNDSDTTPNEQNNATDSSDKNKPSTKKPYKKSSSKPKNVYYQHGTTPHQDPASQPTTPAPIIPHTTEPLEQTPQSTDTTPPYPEDFNIKDLFIQQEPEIITEQPEQAIDIIETESIPSSDNLSNLPYLAPQEQISSRSKLMQPDITMTTQQPFFTESTDDDIVIPTTPKIVQKQKEDKKTIKQIPPIQSKSEIETVPQPSWWEKIATSIQSWWNDIKSWYIKKIS